MDAGISHGERFEAKSTQDRTKAREAETLEKEVDLGGDR
jgi:hypothetical protein